METTSESSSVGVADRSTAVPPAGGAPLLEVRDLLVRFGGVTALQQVSFSMARGAIVGLIGPNGAGKTTLFNCLSRLYAPAGGDILFDGRSLLGVPRYRIAALGIARTFQNVALFDKMSVLANVLVGGHVQGHSGFVANALKLPRLAREEQALLARADELIAFMGIERYRDALVGGLPFPIRKRIELARALMMRPQLLLLDEPAAGLNHEEVETLKAQILRVRAHFGISVLLVEHHMNLVMSISDRVVALNFGQKIADGVPSEVQNDAGVIEAYLGVESE